MTDTTKEPQKKQNKPTVMGSLFMAAASGVITVYFTHPIDVVKTRLQIAGNPNQKVKQYGSLSQTLKVIYSEAGFMTFYKGIQAAVVREALYTSMKIAGSITGILGSFIGNPFDVLKTKMMAAEGEAKGLVFYARQILGERGIIGFYKGVDSNMSRACVLSGTKLGVYSSTKSWLKSFGQKESIILQFECAVIAGFFMSITVTPFDLIRTRLMNQSGVNQAYKNLIDCGYKVVKQEGFKALYKGFIPVWGRFAPATTLQFVIFEQLRTYFGYKNL